MCFALYIIYAAIEGLRVGSVNRIRRPLGYIMPGDKKVLGIRQEDYGGLWERRTPFNPDQVKKIVDQGVKVLMEPCGRRAFPQVAYEEAGAIFTDDLSEASLIIGIKQVPLPSILPDKTYCFFAHVIKAQEENMPLLDAILKHNIRLIDYEGWLDFKGVRLDSVFGQYAGRAGMVNILHGLGLRLLALGYHTPLIHIAAPHSYPSLAAIRDAVKHVGAAISKGAIPKSIGPLTFAFMGAGNVSRGAQEMLNGLPVEFVKAVELKEKALNGDHKKVYATVLDCEDHLVKRDGGKFDLNEYFKQPKLYRSIFPEEIAPWVSCIINGVLWNYDHPRTLTIENLRNLISQTPKDDGKGSPGTPKLPHRLLGVCDITADPGGSLEFVKDCTHIDSPFGLYNINDDSFKTSTFDGPGVLVCAVSNMPSQLPEEASSDFGDLLLPLIPDLLKSDATKSLSQEDLPKSIYDAVITSNGKLTPKFAYIEGLRAKAGV
ncbi:alpha-aminoadipic semialdehyde synthase, mitochondrial-like [Amphiura filiformis]|uniref:alpha-aminoadipic semialdehyde synthase, mitochondrial-like n=1 Tax=Amphiura filiformis TaxID=82378 RepID=UPI003B21FD5C